MFPIMRCDIDNLERNPDFERLILAQLLLADETCVDVEKKLQTELPLELHIFCSAFPQEA